MKVFNEVLVGNIKIANNQPIVLIAGPCQMETKEHSLYIARAIKDIADNYSVAMIFKTSFDKANRTSINSKRGIGIRASIPIFEAIKSEIGCPILTDVHLPEQCDLIAQNVDILQIPAFLCRQTDLLLAAAQTGKVVNIKKGQFLAPWDVNNIITKVISSGNSKVLLTERGVSFGYNRLINDMRGLEIMKKTGYPIVFDATHSVQQPGGLGNQQSSGERQFIKPLARAATSIGISALFLEVHDKPHTAPSDSDCMLHLDDLNQLVKEIKAFDNVAKKYPS